VSSTALPPPVFWQAIILAAGKGTRMRSDLAKVLHEVRGRTLLAHVLDTAAGLPLRRRIVVIGHQAEEVRRRHEDRLVEFVLQQPQLGTGHAVMVAKEALSEPPRAQESALLVLYGDVPLLRESTLHELMECHVLREDTVTVLTARVPDPSGYGRILRGADGAFEAIVEDRDLRPEQRAVDEINSGIYAFRLGPLLGVLDHLRADNAQKEYYLTDALALLRERGGRIGTFTLSDHEEIAGVNTVEQLEEAGAVLDRRAGAAGCLWCDLLRRRDDLLVTRRGGFDVLLHPRPYNSGHLLVIPRRHVVSFESLSGEEAELLLALGGEAESWLEEAYHPQAFNAGYNSGRPGEHLALHVIPRWSGDSNFLPLVAGVNILPELLEQTRRKLQALANQPPGGEPAR